MNARNGSWAVCVKTVQRYNNLTSIPDCQMTATAVALYDDPTGCTPLNTVPILSCVKTYLKNCHFRVFIMIKISQTHVFLKDYVHIHQIGSHFVGGYRLLALGSPRLL